MGMNKAYLDILKAMALQIPAVDRTTTYAELLNVAKGDGVLSEKVATIAKGLGKELTPEQIEAVGAADVLTKEDRETLVASVVGEMIAENAAAPIGGLIDKIFGWLFFWTKYL